MIAGTANRIYLTLLEDDETTPQDLTGASLRWRLGRSYSVGHVLEKTNPAGVVVTDAAAGQAYVDLDATDTVDLQGSYYHEIKADYGSGNEKNWQLGTITVTESQNETA
jgi:hypothetical protein